MFICSYLLHLFIPIVSRKFRGLLEKIVDTMNIEHIEEAYNVQISDVMGR